MQTSKQIKKQFINLFNLELNALIFDKNNKSRAFANTVKYHFNNLDQNIIDVLYKQLVK